MITNNHHEQLHAACVRMGISLDDEVFDWGLRFLERLANQSQNLTAVRDVGEGIDRHLADALSVLTLGAPEGPVCDIGSGGGIPGLVLAAACPDVAFTVVESERRKAEWLSRNGDSLGNVCVVAERSEDFARVRREAFRTVTARAVAPPVPTLELTAPLVAIGGRTIVWSTMQAVDEWDAVQPIASALGYGAGEIHPVTPFEGARRCLVVFPKHSATPEAYPRRPGRATKRPLTVDKEVNSRS